MLRAAMIGRPRRKRYSIVGAGFDNSNLSQYDILVNLGPAEYGRIVVVAAGSMRGSNTRFITGFALDGAGMAIAANVDHGGNSLNANCCLGYIIKPTGTTGTVTVNYSNAMSECGVWVWSLYNFDQVTPVSTDMGENADGTANLNLPTNGVGIMCSAQITAGVGTWVGTGINNRGRLGEQASINAADVSSVYAVPGYAAGCSSFAFPDTFVAGAWR
jgi:hypothetical protein